MWRSIIIYDGEYLSVSDNWLIAEDKNGNKKKVPISDLYCVLIDNMSINLLKEMSVVLLLLSANLNVFV